MGFCSKCGAEILFLTQLASAKNPYPKVNPINAAPAATGNLVIDRSRQLYRFATDEERERAAIENKNLYESHFATCPYAKDFKKTKS
jgi:hypothetical protein